MKKLTLILTVVTVLFAFAGCDDDSHTKMSDNYPGDYDINYALFRVLQYDDVNVNGIDLIDKFDFFDSFRLALHYTDGKISGVTFTNGDIPFSPFGYDVPGGKVDAYLNTEVLPNELRLVDGDKRIADYVNGEFSITYTLDCAAVEYKYTFKSVANQ